MRDLPDQLDWYERRLTRTPLMTFMTKCPQ